MKITIGAVINSLYPFVFGLLSFFLLNSINLSYTDDGFKDALNSFVSVSSIVIGFYTAMYGILISIKNSDLFKILKKNKVEKYFKFQLYESLIGSFLILLFSIIMQLLMYNIIPKNEFDYINVCFIIWKFLVGYFIAVSFRSISSLLKVAFNHDK